MFKKLTLAALPFLFALGGWTMRVEASPTFFHPSNPETAVVGQDFSLDLNTLLSNKGTGTLTWGHNGAVPGWLTITQQGMMSGRPASADVGVTTFQVSVKDSETGALADIVMTVVAPPSWTQNPIDLGTAKEGNTFTFDLNNVIKDNGSGPLTFAASSNLPKWIKVDPSGKLSGTPQRTDVGQFSGFSFTATGSGGASATAQAKINVLINLHPPTWVSDPIAIDNATEDKSYSKDLTSYVKATENAPLTFKILQGPQDNWINLSSAGVLSGTPKRPDVGNVTLQVEVDQVVSGTTLSATTHLTFIVIKVNHPPIWSENPIVLPAGTVGTAYSQDISHYASDPDGNPMTFSLVSGPAWATVSPDGKISGTPPAGSVGPNSFVVAVNDGNFAPQATVQILVKPAPVPPSWLAKPTILPDAKEDAAYSVDLHPYAVDPEGNPMFFSIIDGPTWAKIDSTGAIVGTPTVANLGLNIFHIKVTDNIVGSDTAEVHITVQEVFHGPTWTKNPIPFTTNEEQPFSQDLSQFAKDTDPGVTLTFSLVSGPNWATLSTAGTLSGTPQIANEGENTFVVQANDGHGNTANANVVVTVLHVNHPPSWTLNPINLPNAKERSPYSQSIAQYAHDVDPNPGLVFTKLSGPAWASISPDGTVTGTPQRSDDGPNTFQVRVTDAAGKSADTTVNVVVDRVNLPPQWTENPIPLPDATDGVAYTYDVSPFGKVDDGLTATYSKVSGPAWVTVTPDGKITGTPARSDDGPFSVVIQLSDGTNSVQATANGKVIHINKPPVINQTALNFTVKEHQTLTDTLTKYVTSPDNNPLTFTLVDTKLFVTLGSDGSLTLKPAHSDIGTYKLAFNVNDTHVTVSGLLNITVVRDPQKPIWLQNPIQYQTNINQLFTQNVSKYAEEADGVPLTFSLTDGPSWLKVAPDGTLSGTPTAANLGDNTFTVTAKNDALSADAKVIITVVDPDKPPFWVQNPINLPNAKERSPYSQSLASYAKDPNPGDVPTFTKVSGPAWATVAKDGTISGTPAHSDVGPNSFVVRVSDGEGKSADVTVNITVDRVAQPPVWSQTTIHYTTLINKPFTADLSSQVKDPDGVALTFTKKSGPGWLSVSSTGQLSGTPGTLGDNTFVITATNDQIGSDATVIVTVKDIDHPPQWLQNPIVLPDAKEKTPYSQSLATYISDPNKADTLTFSKLSGPAWASISKDGTVTGTPAHTDIGLGTYQVRATTLAGLSADVTVQITVDKVVHPISWKQDPIPLGDTVAGNRFQFDLTPFVVNPDGNPLTFSKVSGPNWLTVNADGSLNGTPAVADEGAYVATFSVTDGNTTVNVGGFGKVLPPSHPPVLNLEALHFYVNVGQTLSVNLNQSIFVQNPDNSQLSFNVSNPDSWVKLTIDGALSAIPPKGSAGDHTYTLEVKNASGQSAQGPMMITVQEPCQAPLWSQNPINLAAQVSQIFTGNISDKASDPMGKSLTFQKISGPSWLSVGTDGSLTGTPQTSDQGSNTFDIQAKNQCSSADVSVVINVNGTSPHHQTVKVDDVVPNAPSENLWVVEDPKTFWHQDPMAASLNQNISCFYDTLNAAQLHHTGMYLSSDATRDLAKPIKSTTQSLFLLWNESDIVSDFTCRTNSFRVRPCDNSPIWSMFGFYGAFNENSSWKQGYMQPEVPMDVMIVSRDSDMYKNFEQRTTESNASPADFAQKFMDFHAQLKKPYRVSAIAPQCDDTGVSPHDETLDGRSGYPDAGPFKEVTDKTGGQFYPYSCHFDMCGTLKDYAQKIIFRAYVFGKKRIHLTSTPNPVSSITVTLAGTKLSGNTGSANDPWYYDEATQDVVLQWVNIPSAGQLKAGDTIEVDYLAAPSSQVAALNKSRVLVH